MLNRIKMRDGIKLHTVVYVPKDTTQSYPILIKGTAYNCRPYDDEFLQKRNILPHLDDINHPVMTVGSWFDAEDLYGPLNTYQSIEEKIRICKILL